MCIVTEEGDAILSSTRVQFDDESIDDDSIDDDSIDEVRADMCSLNACVSHTGLQGISLRDPRVAQ